MAKITSKNNSDTGIEEKVQLNPMILKGTETKIKKEAKRRNIHPTTFSGQILDRYAHYLLDKETRGDLMVGKKVLELMLMCENDDDFFGYSKKAAEYINTETLVQIEEHHVSFEERENRMQMWHELNGFKFKSTENKEMNLKRWYVVHHMGEKWSKFQCLMFAHLLELTGTSIGKSSHDELSFSIEFKTKEIP